MGSQFYLSELPPGRGDVSASWYFTDRERMAPQFDRPTADLEKRIQGFENKCYRRMLGMSYREHKTNEYIRQQVMFISAATVMLSFDGETLGILGIGLI